MSAQTAAIWSSWRALEATGRLGRDQGVDIRGWERVGDREQADDLEAVDDPAADREWRIQVKRHKTLRPADLRTIVTEAVPDGSAPPYGLIVAAACDVSADALAALREAAAARGIVESHMWSNAYLEDALFLPEHDHLLFAYFGISIATKRRAQLGKLRGMLALKRKIRAAVDDKRDVKNRRLRQSMVVRDIEAAYPDFENISGQMRGYAPPWHAVTLKEIHPLGAVVEHFQYEGIVKPDGTWDIREDTRWWATNSREYGHLFADDENDPTRRQFRGGGEEAPERKMVTELRLIPWANIAEIDPDGDSVLPEPHLICRYDGDEGPYFGRRVFRAYIGGREQALADEGRRQLFSPDVTAGPGAATDSAGPKARRPRARSKQPPGE